MHRKWLVVFGAVGMLLFGACGDDGGSDQSEKTDEEAPEPGVKGARSVKGG